jgi:hypothetical protein
MIWVRCVSFAASHTQASAASDKATKIHELIAGFSVSRARGYNERDSMFWCNRIDDAIQLNSVAAIDFAYGKAKGLEYHGPGYDVAPHSSSVGHGVHNVRDDEGSCDTIGR